MDQSSQPGFLDQLKDYIVIRKSKFYELEKRIANTKKLQEDLKNNYSSIYKEENI